MFLRTFSIFYVICLLCLNVVKASRDYTTNTILQRFFKYELDIELQIYNYSYILRDENTKLFFYPSYEIIENDKKSLRWIGMPCTYDKKIIFEPVNQSDIVKGTFSCNVNIDIDYQDEQKFNGIFYNSQCLESLHQNCFPKPKTYLLNINKESYEKIYFHKIKCKIRYIDQYKGTNVENLLIALEKKLYTDFNTYEGQENKKSKVLELVTYEFIEEKIGTHEIHGISCKLDTPENHTICDVSNIVDAEIANKYLKFTKYNQSHENNINIKYGITDHQMGYDKKESEFEITLYYEKDFLNSSPLLGELFLVTVDENKKPSFKMFGGIVEFKKSGEKVKLKTKKIHYLSIECSKFLNQTEINSNPFYPESCIPVANFVKITFLQHNSHISKNSSLKVYSLNVVSDVYDAKTGKRKKDNWKGIYLNNEISYYQSYTFNKDKIVKSIREDILEPQKTADGRDKIYTDYTKTTSIQKELEYKVEFDYELHEPIDNFINFYPYASETNDKVKKESIRWIGLPCSPSKDKKFDGKIFSGRCHFKYYIENPIIEITGFTGIYYHPKCIESLTPKCWLNPNGVFINLQNKTTNDVKLSFKNLNFKIERFDLAKNKKAIYKLEIKNWPADKGINIKNENNKYASLIKLTPDEMDQAVDDGYIICGYFSQKNSYITCNNINTYFNQISVIEKYLKFKNFNQLLENEVEFTKLVDNLSDYGKSVNSRYKISLTLSHLPEKICNAYAKIYVQKEDKEKKVTFVMFIGMIKLNDFDNPSISIDAITTDVVYFSPICKEYLSFYAKNPNPAYLENCIPFGDSLVISFLSTLENCENILIKYVSVESIIYDPRINNFTSSKWEATFKNKYIPFFKSFKLFKEKYDEEQTIKSKRSGKIIDKPNNDYDYIDYTFNSYLQKRLGYKVNAEATISTNRANPRINFFPVFSRIGDRKNEIDTNFLTWIGKPCTAFFKETFSKHGNLSFTNKIPVKFECQIKDDFVSRKEINNFNGIFYEPICLKKLHKDCWLNNFELLINFGDEFDEKEDIYFIDFNYNFTIFDLLTGKIKTIAIEHKNREPSKENGLKYNDKIGILNLYTSNGFVASSGQEELNCKYLESHKRTTCNKDENIEKTSIFKKVFFPKLIVSPDDIEIFGYNKNHTTVYDKQDNMYEITFEFSKILKPSCKILLEIFVVTFNKMEKILIELYGGILELNQEKFINNYVTIYLKTKHLYFVDKSCNNTVINNDDCLPIGNSIKVTFMVINNETCDNLNVKYVKIVSLIKKKLTKHSYTRKEHEIIFTNPENIEFANTYAIYTSNYSKPVCLNITRPWISEYKKEGTYLLDLADKNFYNNAFKQCNETEYYFMLFLIALILGLIETIILIVILCCVKRRSEKYEIIDNELNDNNMFEGNIQNKFVDNNLNDKKKSVKEAQNKFIIEKKLADVNVVNEEEKSKDEETSLEDNDEDVQKQEDKQWKIHNKKNFKEVLSEEDEGDYENFENQEEYNGNDKYSNEDGDFDDSESDVGIGKKNKNLQKGRKQAPIKGMKKIGKKTAGQPKKKIVGGKKTTSKMRGKKCAVGNKTAPKKPIASKTKIKPKLKPRPARKGGRR